MFGPRSISEDRAPPKDWLASLMTGITTGISGSFTLIWFSVYYLPYIDEHILVVHIALLPSFHSLLSLPKSPGFLTVFFQVVLLSVLLLTQFGYFFDLVKMIYEIGWSSSNLLFPPLFYKSILFFGIWKLNYYAIFRHHFMKLKEKKQVSDSELYTSFNTRIINPPVL